MKLFLKLVLVIFILISLTNCSVQKRLYTKGWDVQWKITKKADFKNTEISETLNTDQFHKEVIQKTEDLPEQGFKYQNDEPSNSSLENSEPKLQSVSTLQNLDLKKNSTISTGNRILEVKSPRKILSQKSKVRNAPGLGDNRFIVVLLVIGLILLLFGGLLILSSSATIYGLISYVFGIMLFCLGIAFIAISLISLLIVGIFSHEKKLKSSTNYYKIDQNENSGNQEEEANSQKSESQKTDEQSNKKQTKSNFDPLLILGITVAAIIGYLVIRNN